jgi:DNA/RNA endonuclease YhcR with UshA esterase domain
VGSAREPARAWLQQGKVGPGQPGVDQNRGQARVAAGTARVAQRGEAGIEDPAAHFKGKTIRVTGRIDLHREQPQIKVTLPEQIEVRPEAAGDAAATRQ